MIKEFLRTIVITILRAEADIVIRKYRPKIGGVTGNTGKTSTKDAVYAVLATTYRVRKSQKSFNSEIGVPLTILGCETGWNNPLLWIYNIGYGLMIIIFPHRYPEWLVLEMGADRPGDIKALCGWLPLDIAVVTNIGDVPVHIEFFKSKEQLAEEKAHLLRALKSDGVAVLNFDDSLVKNMRGHNHHQAVTYGFTADAQVRASHDRVLYHISGDQELPEGISFKITMNGTTAPARIKGIFGKHHVYAALAAIAVGTIEKINLATMLEALQEYEKAPGRLRLIAGEKGSMILDDTYNAAPLATERALESLATLRTTGRRIAILGDMLELGEHTVPTHERIGRLAAKSCDLLVTSGQRARFIADGAREAGMAPGSIQSFDISSEASEYVEPLIQPGDLVLVKGSQGARMERVVLDLMAHPEDAPALLVRQEKEWQNR